jgi:catechol 2,3-dioxygenase-like lactoylglutathione lyase family enzyme
MLDHIILTVSDVERSLAFYEAALKPLNIKFFMPYKGEDGHPDLWGFGDGKRAFFWIKQGKPDPAAIHWGFMAEDEDKVDEFYKAAISAGARNNISPRARLEYYPGYYAADVFDPDGYSFEVVHKSWRWSLTSSKALTARQTLVVCRAIWSPYERGFGCTVSQLREGDSDKSRLARD